MTGFDIKRIEEAYAKIDPVFLNSPQYQVKALNEVLETELELKVEIDNPLLCFKGRGADFVVSKLPAEKSVVCASAGNFGLAMAYACRKRRISLIVYAAENASSVKIEKIRNLDARVVLHGKDFDFAKLQAKQFALREQATFIEDGLQDEIALGAGTIAIEMLRSLPLDYVLVPVGNGALINGVGSVFKALNPATTIIAVQAAGASAMIESWRNKKLTVHDDVNTIADGISVRIPIAESLCRMEKIVDDGLLVSDESILKAMALLKHLAGIYIEPSAAVGIAAILQYPEKFRKKRGGTILTGANITEAQVRNWFSE